MLQQNQSNRQFILFSQENMINREAKASNLVNIVETVNTIFIKRGRQHFCLCRAPKSKWGSELWEQFRMGTMAYRIY